MTPADTALALCTRPELLGSVGGAARYADPGRRRRRPAGADGTDGEVVVRGPQLMTGTPAPGRDAHRAAPGWLHTGDVGHLDAEGYLYLTDRLTDVIVSAGENVYSGRRAGACTHPASPRAGGRARAWWGDGARDRRPASGPPSPRTSWSRSAAGWRGGARWSSVRAARTSMGKAPALRDVLGRTTRQVAGV
jgi:hypothetical protein